MIDAVLLGAAHWHVPMHVAACAACHVPIRGIWDPDPGQAAARAAEAGLTAFASVEQALGCGAKLAIVTGRPQEMPERIIAAAERGFVVLTEKPISTDALAPLAARAAREGWFVAAALPHAVGPVAQAAIGRPRHLSFRLLNGPPERYREWGVGWVLDPAVGLGGALRNLGVHGVDLAARLFGPDVAVTSATMRRWHGEAVEDHAVVTLEGPDGATACVEAGYLHPSRAGSDFEIRCYTKDLLLLDRGDALQAFGPASSVEPVTPLPGRYDDMLRDVVARLAAGERPAADLGDLCRAMALIDAAYRFAGA